MKVIRVVTLDAKMTNNSPTTTWLAALGLSFFQSPIIGQLEAMPFVDRVESLFSVPQLRSVDGYLKTDPYLKTLPESAEAAEQLGLPHDHIVLSVKVSEPIELGSAGSPPPIAASHVTMMFTFP